MVAVGAAKAMKTLPSKSLFMGTSLRHRPSSSSFHPALRFPDCLGPHCAIGEIEYPGNRQGILLYIKSSLTGDENDYILYYKQRYARFPHETTLDQLFSEEQFEGYRALGFHAAYDLFDKRANFAHLDPVTHPRAPEILNALDKLLPPVSEKGRTFEEAI